MVHDINEHYSNEMRKHGFKRGAKFGHSVHFKNESTNVDLYLSTAKKMDNRSVIIHPGYDHSLHELTEDTGIKVVQQGNLYFHDSSLTAFPKRLIKPGAKVSSYYGIELFLSNSYAIESLCRFLDLAVCQNKLQLDLATLDIEQPDIDKTQIKSLIDARIGQGKWRRELDKYWIGCSVTGCTISCLLRGSHIKPWRDSSNKERLDLHNGLLLRADVDALFDRGMLSFSDSGEIIISNALTQIEIQMLPFSLDLKISKLKDEHLSFLEYHRGAVLVEV